MQNQTAIAKLKTLRIIEGQVLAYWSLHLVRTVQNERSVKPHRIVLGEHSTYWLVSPADAERLQRAGYEVLVD
jgi:hypothetical protein